MSNSTTVLKWRLVKQHETGSKNVHVACYAGHEFWVKRGEVYKSKFMLYYKGRFVGSFKTAKLAKQHASELTQNPNWSYRVNYVSEYRKRMAKASKRLLENATRY